MYLRFKSNVFPVKGLLTVLGATLLLISLALDFSYANLNTYVISYLRSKDESITYEDWIFVTTCKTFIQGILMPFMGNLEKKIGTKYCILLGCIIYTGGITLTYFTIDHGLIPTVLTLSASHGIGFSLVYAQAIGAAIKWFLNSNKGLMSSIAVAGYGFGAAVWIPIETIFVNPKNIEAVNVTFEENADKYFVEGSVLDAVPKLFLLLGGIFISLQLLGLMLLRTPEKDDLQETTNFVKKAASSADGKAENLTAFQTISKHEFWLLWLIFMSIQMMQSFVNSYQKTYGQKFIQDDFYFSYVGLASNILNGLSRIGWGLFFDLRGFKFNAYVIGGVSTFLTWTFLLLYVIETEMAQKVFFGLWLCGFYAFFPGIYATMAPVTQATFGHLNYSRDYGLLFTQSMVGSLVLIISAQFLFQYIGYVGMFSICGSVGLFGLLSIWRFPAGKHE